MNIDLIESIGLARAGIPFETCEQTITLIGVNSGF
jgi:hypothetical protein